jgi:hypothetical protein
MSEQHVSCINCKYLASRRWRYMMGSYELVCSKYVESRNIVNGAESGYRCHYARRRSDLCGVHGLGFEPFVPKTSLWRRIISFVGRA